MLSSSESITKASSGAEVSRRLRLASRLDVELTRYALRLGDIYRTLAEIRDDPSTLQTWPELHAAIQDYFAAGLGEENTALSGY